MIGKTIGQYKIVDKLGEGGMGVVYKAHDDRLDRFVALKFLPLHFIGDEEQRQRFVQEAKAVSSLDHPNVCTVYEIGETHQGQTFIAMAHYEGVTLKDKLTEGSIPLEKVLRYSVHIARGLSRAHDADVTHRDIKPANIIVVSRHDEAKILDFGIAKLARSTGLTKTGTTMGTVSYMSPEQARGGVVDHRTDIWSLGVMMYEMLAGERPFKGDFEQAIIYSILNEEELQLSGVVPGIPKEISRVVHRALAKDAGKRYGSIPELLQDIEPINQQLSGDSPVSGTTTFPIQRRRGRGWLAAVGVTIAAVVALGYFLLPKSAPVMPDDSRKVAAASMETARTSERQALVAGAHERSASDIATADSLTALAKMAFDSGRYETAAAKYDLATAAYQQAGDTARRVEAEEFRQGADGPATRVESSPPLVEESPPRVEESLPKPVVGETTNDKREGTNRSDAAKRARTTMNDAKVALAGLSVADRSTLPTFGDAERKEEDAERAFSLGEFGRAATLFREASDAYTEAAASAKKASQQAQAEAETLRDEARGMKTAFSPDHKYVAEYRHAEESEQRGITDLQKGRYRAAALNFKAAVASFDAVRIRRTKQVDDIHRLVNRYADALESEDLAALGSLYSDFSPQIRNDWAKFFNTVDDLRTEMDVESIDFRPRSATAHLTVRLIYRRAGGTDVPHRWDLLMDESDEGWRISNVEQNN